MFTTASCFLRGTQCFGCTADNQCHRGDVCVQGLCVECRSAQDCKEGFVCDGTRCVAASADAGLLSDR